MIYPRIHTNSFRSNNMLRKDPHNPFHTNNNFLKVSILIKTTTQTHKQTLLRE